MSDEAIYKLQPHRTMHLRGFDGRGAAAAMHGASATGFTGADRAALLAIAAKLGV